MRFVETGLAGAWLVDLEERVDERGFFARSFCEREFAKHGLAPRFVQCNVSWNRRAGTLRGMHWQHQHAEAKLVRCTRGAIFDVIVDLRPGSATRDGVFHVELDAKSRRALYVPEGFAHGFQSLEDDSEVFYQMSEFFVDDASRGFRFDDPALAIPWPLPISVISDRDRDLPLLEDAR